ncbi:DUF2061 domain-containing protein [Massilia sp. TN1-12]|uniref:DUF2061 domain-containing protein n=1 Tax=Massilia paldalensis TaxID=3377675 RepID=UPI00384AEF02
MVVARKSSQVITHMAIGFVIAYAFTGSIALGGLAVLVEPVLNVLLLPFHERAWARKAQGVTGHRRTLVRSVEKISQTGMHMVVAFLVMFFATGSLAFGGMAAVLEPVCNVLLMPLHDKLWDNVQAA